MCVWTCQIHKYTENACCVEEVPATMSRTFASSQDFGHSSFRRGPNTDRVELASAIALDFARAELGALVFYPSTWCPENNAPEMVFSIRPREVGGVGSVPLSESQQLQLRF